MYFGNLLIKKEMTKKHIDLVYGDSSTGLMGEISDEVYKNGGNTILRHGNETNSKF